MSAMRQRRHAGRSQRRSGARSGAAAAERALPRASERPETGRPAAQEAAERPGPEQRLTGRPAQAAAERPPAALPPGAPWPRAAAGGPPAAAFLRGFVYAGRGLAYAVRTQRNARVHALLGAAALALGVWLRLSPVEFALVFVAITGVFVAEMFNTVAEACVDLITNEYHPLARIAKDVAAGAVLLNAILSVAIALFVYVPHLWPLALRWLGR